MIPFAGNPLNRASEKRTDAKWIEAKRHDPTSLVLPMWQLQPFLLGQENSGPPFELGLLSPEVVDSVADMESICVLLGLDREHATFAIDLAQNDEWACIRIITPRPIGIRPWSSDSSLAIVAARILPSYEGENHISWSPRPVGFVWQSRRSANWLRLAIALQRGIGFVWQN